MTVGTSRSRCSGSSDVTSQQSGEILIPGPIVSHHYDGCRVLTRSGTTADAPSTTLVIVPIREG